MILASAVCQDTLKWKKIEASDARIVNASFAELYKLRSFDSANLLKIKSLESENASLFSSYKFYKDATSNITNEYSKQNIELKEKKQKLKKSRVALICSIAINLVTISILFI